MTAIAAADNTELVLAHRDGLSWWTRDALLDTPTKQVWQWEPEEVAKFVSLVEGMEFFSQIFIDHHVTGVRFLRMNESKLAQLGINTAAARENLKTEIALIRKWGVSKHVHWYVTDDDHQPGHIIEGLVDGTTELIRGILEGLVGVIYEPAKAVRQDGSDGFYGGLGLGIMGIIFRPLGGLCDFVRNISDGIKNTPRCLDSEEEIAAYLKQKVDRELDENKKRREQGKKQKRPNTIDDDFPAHILRGVLQGVGRFCIQWYLGVHVFLTAPCQGAANGQLAKGIFRGIMSLICRPTAGCLDLVQRIFEGLVNTPDAIFDSCQLEDFRQRQAVVGSELWWERVADPQGAAAMGLGVQGAAGNVSSVNKNVNAEVGPLATNTLGGMSQNLNDGVDNAAVPVHFQQQVAEARAAAIGAAQTVENPAAMTTLGATLGPGPSVTSGQQTTALSTVPLTELSAGGFCISCGTQFVAGAQFCAGCGKPCSATSRPSEPDPVVAADMV